VRPTLRLESLPLHPMKMSRFTIFRKPLLSATLGSKNVTSVDVREITFAPGQETGRHQHPCPVLGFIAEGEAVLQLEGEPRQHLSTGSAFYEPAETVISRFDNASAERQMRFICFYLMEGSQELIQMLPEAA
jgi:quercetin dioxygenase-like cupin family protein